MSAYRANGDPIEAPLELGGASVSCAWTLGTRRLPPDHQPVVVGRRDLPGLAGAITVCAKHEPAASKSPPAGGFLGQVDGTG